MTAPPETRMSRLRKVPPRCQRYKAPIAASLGWPPRTDCAITRRGVLVIGGYRYDVTVAATTPRPMPPAQWRTSRA
jgi:hypothetical protein